MINKENENIKEPPHNENEDKFIDNAKMDVQCHIIIKDKDTDKILVNKRG